MVCFDLMFVFFEGFLVKYGKDMVLSDDFVDFFLKDEYLKIMDE